MEGSGIQPDWDPLIANGASGVFLAQLSVFNGDAGLGLASSTVGSVPINVGQWYDYQLILNYTNQTAYGFVDSTFIGSGPLAHAATSFEFPAFGLYADGDDATGYWDNLSVTAAPAPEPSAFAMALLGVLPLVWEARRRTRQRKSLRTGRDESLA